MKPLYRCDYCTYTGTEEEVNNHEAICIKNYNLKGCLSCAHCNTDGFTTIMCEVGRDIPEGKMFEDCDSYERREKVDYNSFFNNLFGGMF